MDMSRPPHRVKLYVDDDGVLEQSTPYANLLTWAWDDLDELEDDVAKSIADGLANAEIASFSGTTTFGLDGYIEFPSEDQLVAFLIKWG